MTNLINQQDTLNQGREKLNNAIKAFNEAVVKGDSSVEAAQARVDEQGNVHPTLQVRLNEGFADVKTTMSRSLANKRDKASPIGLNDVDGEFLGIIQNGPGGTPVNVLSIPREKSVTPSKTTFIQEDPQNLFDPQAITDGVRLNVDGTFVSDPAWYTSGKMPVVSGKTYLVFGNSTVTGRIVGFNQNGDFLKVVSAGVNTAGGAKLPIDFTGFVMVPFSASSAPKDTIQFVDSAVYNGKFTPYNLSLGKEISVSLEALPDRSVSHRLLSEESVGNVNIGQAEVDLSFHTEQTPLVFPERQVNLFNKETVKPDFYIAQASGKETANSSYVASAPIRVTPGKNYSMTHRNQGAWYGMDKKTFVAGIPNVAGNIVTAPPGGYFMRMSVLKNNLDSQMIVEGESLPGTYQEHFSQKSKKLLKALEEVQTTVRLKTPEEIVRHILFSGSGKVKLIGDSRTHGSGGSGYKQDGEVIPGTNDVRTSPNGHSWANSFRDLLAWKYGITVVNYGISGSNSQGIRNIIASLIEPDDDLIIMMLGTNDRHNFPSAESIKTNQRAIIEYAHSMGIPVILMSAPPVAVVNDNDPIRNFGMFEVDKALKELALDYNMQHISNYDNTLKYCEYRGVTPDDLLADGLHENDAGHDVIFRHVVRSLGLSYVRPGVTK